MASNKQPGGDKKKPYNIHKISETVARKYGVEEYTYKVKFHNEMNGEPLENVQEELTNMFEEVVSRVSADYDLDDKVRISIDHSGLDRPMTIHLQPRRNITGGNITGR
jgi:hypothetical protein